jgi:hypothetical protein
MLYSSYTASGSLYLFSDSLTRYTECVRRDVRYDGNFSADDSDRLTVKQRKLEAVREALLNRIL